MLRISVTTAHNSQKPLYHPILSTISGHKIKLFSQTHHLQICSSIRHLPNWKTVLLLIAFIYNEFGSFLKFEKSCVMFEYPHSKDYRGSPRGLYIYS